MGKMSPLYTTDGWYKALRSPEFIAYLAVSRPPLQGSRSEIVAARRTLWATPLIRDLLASQLPSGDWPSAAPGKSERLWFRQFPIPLSVLCEAGFSLDDEPVRRGSLYLLSTLEDGVFRNPWREIDEPLEYYEAHIGHCLEAAARCHLSNDVRVQRAVEVALQRQRWDGGWSTRPSYTYRKSEPRPDPEPSCPLCSGIMMRGLGLAGRLPAAAVDRIMDFHLDERYEGPIEESLPELLIQLEFLANQGRRAGDPHVQRLLRRLESARDEDGSFLPHQSSRGYYPPEYTQYLYNYLRWWCGD